MIIRVACLQRHQLALQHCQLLFESLRIGRILRRSPSRQLLRQQRLRVRAILLCPVYGLSIRVQLGIQSHQDFQIVIGIAGQLAHVLALESCHLAVLVI